MRGGKGREEGEGRGGKEGKGKDEGNVSYMLQQDVLHQCHPHTQPCNTHTLTEGST